MIVVRKTNGDATEWPGADEVQPKGREYILLHKGKPIGMIPRENVDEFVFTDASQPNT